MYYVIHKKNSYFLYFLSFEQSMKKIMMVKEKKILLKCIEMQDLHAIFFNSNIVLIIFIIFVCRFLKKIYNEV